MKIWGSCGNVEIPFTLEECSNIAAGGDNSFAVAEALKSKDVKESLAKYEPQELLFAVNGYGCEVEQAEAEMFAVWLAGDSAHSSILAFEEFVEERIKSMLTYSVIEHVDGVGDKSTFMNHIDVEGAMDEIEAHFNSGKETTAEIDIKINNVLIGGIRITKEEYENVIQHV